MTLFALTSVLGTVSCGGGNTASSPTAFPQLDPNAFKIIALSKEDVGGGFEESESRFVTPEDVPESGAPSGWRVGYRSAFTASDLRVSLVDDIENTLELYFDPMVIRENIDLPVFSSNFDKYEVSVGDESVGYAYVNGVDGRPERSFIIRFLQGPVIATISVDGQSDLTHETGKETALRYARAISQRIGSMLESS